MVGVVMPKKIGKCYKSEIFLSPESQLLNISLYIPAYHCGAHSTLAPRVPQWDSAPVTQIYWVPSCPCLNCLFCLLVFSEIASRINLCLRISFWMNPNYDTIGHFFADSLRLQPDPWTTAAHPNIHLFL